MYNITCIFNILYIGIILTNIKIKFTNTLLFNRVYTFLILIVALTIFIISDLKKSI